jgi:tetratricopeptide (TPR) repeat protein
MPRPVFISYARGDSAAQAQALADRLGELAFLDTEAIEDGEEFPPRLLDGILDAGVVVIFATKAYTERPFCRLEMRLALAGGDAEASHIVMALGEGFGAVLDAMPASVAGRNWPAAGAAERLEGLVRRRLGKGPAPIRAKLAEVEARKLAAAFLEQSKTIEPGSLHGVVCSLPPGVAGQSIGGRFVGRAEDLRRLHRILSQSGGGAARLTGRITAGGGFGKTRLAVEYAHRYGPRYYRGGIFWVNAASDSIEDEFWRVLSVLAAVPDIAAMRAQGRDIRRELERALRGIPEPALYVIDNVPEAAPGKDPPTIGEFCPALGAVTVVATSRQDTREEGVRTISVDELEPAAAILLLTENVPGAGALSWDEWERIAGWVGNLPIALDLLNRSLALNSISAQALLQRVKSPGATAELDGLREALRGQVPEGAVHGVTEAFLISFEKLDKRARSAAMLLAQLAPAPIPEAVLEALPERSRSPAVRAALRSRHFVTPGGDLSFGVMHRLMADFLRSRAGERTEELIETACRALLEVMKTDRCLDPRHWPVMTLCRPHAEALFERAVAINAALVPSATVGLAAAFLAREQGDYAESRRLGERVLEATARVLGEEHPTTLTVMNNRATTLWVQGNRAEARLLQERVLEATTRVLGEEHPATLRAMGNLAETLREQGDHAGARRLQERVLEVMTRVLGEEHPNTLTAMENLAITLHETGEVSAAVGLVRRCLAGQRRVLGDQHPATAATAELLKHLGEQPEAGS